MTQSQSDNIKYTECYVAFIDILGFSGIVEKSVTDSTLLAKLTRAMNFLAEPGSGTKVSRRQNAAGHWEENRWLIQTRAFSDSVAIFMPTETGSISQMLFVVRYLHDRMLELELCMRGAVTSGVMYLNDAWSNPAEREEQQNDLTNGMYERGLNQDFPVTLGPGLIDAYKLEDECAIYPRLLISPSLYEYVEREGVKCPPIGPYNPSDRPLTDFFRTDADGLHFLDVLHPDVMRSDTERIVRSTIADGRFSIELQRDGNTQSTLLEHVDKVIEKGMKLSDNIREKYEWLKSYRESVQR